MKFLISLVLILSSIAPIYSQLFLQIEEKNNPKTKKIPIGSTLNFKLKAYPDTWRTQKIFDLLPEENTIVFDENFFKPSEISNLRFYRNWTKGFGYKLMQASAAWYVYGGIATLAVDNYTMSKRDVVIGGVAATTGFLLKTLFYKRNMRIGKNFNLRIVDLNFYSPNS